MLSFSRENLPSLLIEDKLVAGHLIKIRDLPHICQNGCWYKTGENKFGEEVEKRAATIKNSMAFPPKLKLELPYDSAFPLWVLNPKKMKTLTQNTCTPCLL